MAQVRLINRFGKVTGWNDVSVRLFGRVLEGITEVSYSDEQEIEPVYGGGGMPIGKGKGYYKAKASVSLTQEERVALMQSLPPGMRIQDVPDFDIIVAFEYQNQVYKDVIRNCSFKNDGVEIKSGDKSMAFKFDLVPTHIDKNQ